MLEEGGGASLRTVAQRAALWQGVVVFGMLALFFAVAALGAAVGVFLPRNQHRVPPTTPLGWTGSIGSSALFAALFVGVLAVLGVFGDEDAASLAGLAAVLFGAQEAGALVAARVRLGRSEPVAHVAS